MKPIRLLALSLVTTLTASAQNTYPFPASGNIGIGTTTPEAPLEVNGRIRSSSWHPYGSISNDFFVDVEPNTRILRTRNWNEAAPNIAATGIHTGTGFFEGNVGIGTSDPQTKLAINVFGLTTAGGQLPAGQTNSTHTFDWGIQASGDSADNGRSSIQFRTRPGSGGSNSEIAFFTNQYGESRGERLTVDPRGNVGIGTVSPSAKLEVMGGEVRIPGGTNPTGWSTHFNWAGDGRNYIRGTTLIADNGGNVGIGTTNPTHKLAVNGTIKAKEVIVETTGWSDYVFADDYALQPLSEVEAHIRTNKHLPGIPSAADVAEQGVSVGEMQAKLLAKIEELTLHQIAQEKSLKAEAGELRALLAAQAEELTALRSEVRGARQP